MKQYNYKKRAVIHGLSMAVFLGACLGLQADDQNKGVSAQATVNGAGADASVSSDRSSTSTSASSSSDRFGSDANRNASGKLDRTDANFVREAADGGLMEVKMGQMAKDHGNNADVKSYGERLVKDHTKANDKLSQLASQKGVNLAKDMEPHKTGMLKDWENKNGADFDKAFIQHALKDHKKDIDKFEKASRDLKDSELRSFAMETLPTLREHYTEAQRIARSLGIDVNTADTSGYQRDTINGVGASGAAGSPGVSIEQRSSSNDNIDKNATGHVDVDVDRTRNSSGGASVNVDTSTSKSGDHQSSYNNNSSSSSSTPSASASVSNDDSQKTLGVTTQKGDGKTLGVTTQKGDGRTLGLNTSKDDGKYLGLIPTFGHKKAENRVDVDMDRNQGASASASVGTSGGSQTGSGDADVSVTHDDKSATKLSYSELPQAVQDTIKSHGGSANAKSIRKHTENGKTVYNVSIEKDGKNEKLKIAEDGTVIKDNNK